MERLGSFGFSVPSVAFPSTQTKYGQYSRIHTDYTPSNKHGSKQPPCSERKNGLAMGHCLLGSVYIGIAETALGFGGKKKPTHRSTQQHRSTQRIAHWLALPSGSCWSFICSIYNIHLLKHHGSGQPQVHSGGIVILRR